MMTERREDDAGPAAPLRLPIHERETVVPGEAHPRARFVFCPSRGRSLDPAICESCPHAARTSPTAVECRPPTGPRRWAPDTPVGLVASAPFTCVRADVPAERIAAFFPVEPWPLPVVDSRERFVGFVSNAGSIFGASHVVAEDASLHEAIEWLAHRHTRVLAVVASDGTLRAVLRDVEALEAWALASRDEWFR